METALCIGCGLLVAGALPLLAMVAGHLLLGRAPDID